MDRLKQIIRHKRQEVLDAISSRSEEALRDSPLFHIPTRPFALALKAAHPTGLIAEFKRRSPSAGDIGRGAAGVDEQEAVRIVARSYEAAGAAAMSVLTDARFFGGSREDLTAAKAATSIPVLRKDFIIHPYQIVEAKAMGADAVLLIAECLERGVVEKLVRRAHRCGLEVLFELHAPDQLDKLVPGIHAVGINNRDLTDFSIDVNRSLQIMPELLDQVRRVCPDAALVTESGFFFGDQAAPFVEAGFDAFLIGSAFMGTENPGRACAAFIADLRQKVTAT